MNEIIFSYNDERCHAEVVSEIPEGAKLLGELDGYLLYQKKTAFFDQFGFVAIKKESELN